MMERKAHIVRHTAEELEAIGNAANRVPIGRKQPR